MQLRDQDRNRDKDGQQYEISRGHQVRDRELADVERQGSGRQHRDEGRGGQVLPLHARRQQTNLLQHFHRGEVDRLAFSDDHLVAEDRLELRLHALTRHLSRGIGAFGINDERRHDKRACQVGDNVRFIRGQVRGDLLEQLLADYLLAARRDGACQHDPQHLSGIDNDVLPALIRQDQDRIRAVPRDDRQEGLPL